MEKPTGPERQVRFIGGTSIDGAPIAYIIALAAVIAALAFIPLSVILSSGGSFPMSQAIYGLLGWILGPVAGAVSSGIGTIVGIFIAPHTAGIPLVRFYGAVLASFAAGCMLPRANRKAWWIPVAVLAVLSLAVYIGRALQNGAHLQYILPGSFLDWSATLLFILPTRTLFGRWINSTNFARITAGLFLGTWVVFGVSHVCQSAIIYMMQNWPEKIWILLIPTIPVEMLVRSTVGALIGTGVIAGMRAINLPRPSAGIL